MEFYVCDIIGDGAELNPYRPAIAGNIGDGGLGYYRDFNVAAIPSNQDGTPATEWCLAMHENVVNLPGVTRLQSQANQAALEEILTAKNIPINKNAPEFLAAIKRLK